MQFPATKLWLGLAIVATAVRAPFGQAAVGLVMLALAPLPIALDGLRWLIRLGARMRRARHLRLS